MVDIKPVITKRR